MKQIRLTIVAFALCALFAGAKAQTVTVADVEALPGETVAFSLNLTGGKAGLYKSMQFDIQFPATGFTTTGDYSVSPLWKNATANVGMVNADGLATVPVSSADSISAADVEALFSVYFTVGSEVAIGEYNVTLKNLWFGYGKISKDYPEDVTFKVKVVDHHTILLDENSTTAPTNTSGVDVRVLRTIKANDWSTICLPFAMTEAQVKTAFGDDVQLADFVDYDIEEDTDENIIGISINFENVPISGGMEANHPYLIKVNTPVTEFTVDNVDVDPDEDNAVIEYDNGKTGKKRVVYGTLYGVYRAETVIENRGLFLNSNKFWYSTGLTKIKAFRAYFILDDVLSNVENASAKIRFNIGDESTCIDGLELKPVADGVYTVQGQFVGNGVELERLPKGVYIVNGKKVVKP